MSRMARLGFTYQGVGSVLHQSPSFHEDEGEPFAERRCSLTVGLNPNSDAPLERLRCLRGELPGNFRFSQDEADSGILFRQLHDCQVTGIHHGRRHTPDGNQVRSFIALL